MAAFYGVWWRCALPITGNSVTEKKEEGISVFSEACPLTRLGHMGNGSVNRI